MAEITAAAAKILAESSASALSEEMGLIYDAITSAATAGMFKCMYLLTQPALKAAVINQLSNPPNNYIVTVKDDGNLMIEWG